MTISTSPKFRQLPADAGLLSAQLQERPLPIESRSILGTRVDGTNYAGAVDQIIGWAVSGLSRYVCSSTVHMVMEGYDDPGYRQIVSGADMVTSDGMPLVWALRLLGVHHAKRVYAPDLTLLLCERAERDGIPVGFYGSTPEVMEAMVANLRTAYPTLEIAYQYSPPFRALSEDEIEQEIEEIRASGARIMFVGLGCPKQERWMHARRGRIDAVMLGMGATFDFVAKTKAQAPDFLQALGLEWLFRLATEPRRLWYRYLYHNPRFVGLFVAQAVRERFLKG